MLKIKYLFEVQYLLNETISQRAYIISPSQEDIEEYANKNSFKVIHIKTIAANIGDPGAKANEVCFFKDLTKD